MRSFIIGILMSLGIISGDVKEEPKSFVKEIEVKEIEVQPIEIKEIILEENILEETILYEDVTTYWE